MGRLLSATGYYRPESAAQRQRRCVRPARSRCARCLEWTSAIARGRMAARRAMAQVLAEVRLAGSPLRSYSHVCAFFRSPDEFYTVLLPFIKEGFDRHERALHIVDPKLR